MLIANKKNVVIFSDDIEWCINNFNVYANKEGLYNVYFISDKIFKENELYIKTDIEFILMSMFKNNIIANSYFSLWASFISYYKTKIIIAPKRWYSCDGYKEYDEVYHKYITHKTNNAANYLQQDFYQHNPGRCLRHPASRSS
jgi:hypothetical protein